MVITRDSFIMSDLLLSPIGTSPAWYNPGEPTTGLLLEHRGYRVLVDCGAGVVARYLERFGPDEPLDAIVVTHVHADHAVDLVPLKYGIDYGALHTWHPQLWLPPGGHDRLRTLVSAWDGPRDFFDSTFDVHDYHAGRDFQVGPLAARALEVPHFIEAFALRLGADGATFAYSSDLGPCDEVAPFVRGVDLLLCEATLPQVHAERPDSRGHLTTVEAATIARDGEVGSLLLTHMPLENDPERQLELARQVYHGPVALADSSRTYSVGTRLAKVG